MNNFYKFYLRDSFNASALLFSAGSIIQGFMAFFGVDSVRMGYFTSVVTATQVATMLIYSGLADRVKDCKKAVALITVQYVWFFIAAMVLCFFPNTSSSMAFWIILIFGVIQNVFIGMRSALDYKLPYLTIDMKKYAQLNAISGICSGICCVAVNLVFSKLLNSENLQYLNVSVFGFAFGAVFILLSAFMTTRLKVNSEALSPEKEKSKVSLLTILKSKSFLILALPNLLRGLCMGTIGMAAVIWLENINGNPASTAVLVTISTLGSMFSCLGYSFLSRYVRQNVICITGSIALVVFMPLMMAGNNSVVFCIFYLLANVGYIFVNNSVPCRIAEVVPYDMIAGYSALRLSITMGGSALASLIVGYLVGNVPSWIILVSAGALQLASGLVFLLYRPEEKTSKAK
ncbi:MAG: hypothetical protein IKM29_01715 [Clostridia bacterium]|nr:hypothetical protein [Clostridia bacterium]